MDKNSTSLTAVFALPIYLFRGFLHRTIALAKEFSSSHRAVIIKFKAPSTVQTYIPASLQGQQRQLREPFFFLHTAFAIYQSLPYFESFGTYSTKLPFDLSIYFPYVLKIYLIMLFIGKCLFLSVFSLFLFWFVLPSTLIERSTNMGKNKKEA